MKKQALQEYQTAYNEAAGGDSTLVSIKNDKRAILRSLLSQLAEYVNSTANGDKSKLLSSGFPLARKRGDAHQLPPIDKLEVDIGTPEQAVTLIKKVPGAKAYIHQYTTDMVTSEAKWIDKVTTEPKNTFTNLQSAVKHFFRVIAIGPNGQTVHSPIVSRIIQ